MPEISRFYGIRITMYVDHPPAHFHIEYGEEKAIMNIVTGELVGKLKPTARALVNRWRELHLQELMTDWESLQTKGNFFKIEPLE